MAVVQYTYTHKQYREQHNRHKQYIEQHKKIHRATQQLGRVRAVLRLCEFYPGICLTTEEKARKNLIQVSRTMPVGKEYTEQSIHNNKNT